MLRPDSESKHETSMARSQRGMTFVEVLIILAIMALTAAVALPNLLMAQVRARADREMRAVGSMFDFARSEAIKRHSPVTVSFDANGNGTVETNEREMRILDSGGALLRTYTLSPKFEMNRVPGSEISSPSFVYASDGSLTSSGPQAIYFGDMRGNYFRLFTTQFMGSPRAEMWTGTLWSPRRRDWNWK